MRSASLSGDGRDEKHATTSTISAAQLMALNEGEEIAHFTFPRASGQRGCGASNPGRVACKRSELRRDYHTYSTRSRLPALQRLNKKGSRVTLRGVFMRICATVLGSFMMSCPFALAKAGVVFGVVIAAAVAVAASFSLIMLARCAEACERYEHEDIVDMYLGVSAKRAAQASQLVMTALAVAAQLIVFADLITPLAKTAFPDHEPWWISWPAVLSFGAGLQLPSALLTSYSSAATIASYAGVFASVLLLVALAWPGSAKLGLALSVVDSSASDVGSSPVDFLGEGRGGAAAEAMLGVPVWIVAFSFHPQILEMYRNLPTNKKPLFPAVAHTAVGVAGIMALAIGVLGVVRTGNAGTAVGGNFLSPLVENGSGLLRVAAMTFGVAMLLAVPGGCTGLRSIVARIVRDANKLEEHELRPLQQILLWVGTPLMLVAVTGLAFVIGDVAKCADLMGSSTGMVLSFVFPGLAYAALCESSMAYLPQYRSGDPLASKTTSPWITTEIPPKSCPVNAYSARERWCALAMAGVGMGIGTVSLMATLLAW